MISNLQWYFLRSKNPVYLVMDIDHQLSIEGFHKLLFAIRASAPLLFGHFDQKNEVFVPDSTGDIAKNAKYCEVDDLSTCLRNEYENMYDIFRSPEKAVMRINCYVTPEENGPGRSLVVFTSMHAVVEGVDIAYILRNRHAPEIVAGQTPNIRKASWLAFVASLLVTVPLHHLLARISGYKFRQPIVRHIVLQRAEIRARAKSLQVSQKALLFALVRAALNQRETRSATKLSNLRNALPRLIAYTTYTQTRELGDDESIKLKLRTSLLSCHGSLEELARRFDRMLLASNKKQFVFQRLNTLALGLHRRLERIFPRLYTGAVFGYLPFRQAYTLLPPFRGEGDLEVFRDCELLCGSIPQGSDVFTFTPMDKTVVLALAIDEAETELQQDFVRTFNSLGYQARVADLERSF